MRAVKPMVSGGVVLLHGIARTARSMGPMQRALAAAGYATLNLGYASRKKSLEQLADDIHPAVVRFADGIAGPLHFVTHSMGGLVARAYLARYRPARLGRVVMLGPPNNGSEVADALRDWPAYRWLYGPAGQQLTTAPYGGAGLLPIDFDLGVIAGNRTINLVLSNVVLPWPNDGKVSVASTKIVGMADHVVIGVPHPFQPQSRSGIAQTLAFLRVGRFS